MNTKFAAVSLGLVLTLTTCHSTTAIADETQDTQINRYESSGALSEIVEKSIAQSILDSNTENMDRAVAKLKKQLWSSYGLGGGQPGYWDCSGLVRWFYGNLNVEIRHSATAQARAGKKVNTPKIGDIVAFHYGSKKYSFHTGIYVGDGKVLHAYNPVADTLISKIKDVADDNNASFSYRRIINTN